MKLIKVFSKRTFFWLFMIGKLKHFKVFNASNVDIVTKTRTEHLLGRDKERLVDISNICFVLFRKMNQRILGDSLKHFMH